MSTDTRNAIGSQVSAVGALRYDSRAFQMRLPFGLDRAHASHLAATEKRRHSTTNGTYGRISTESSASAALRSSLESRLRTRLKTDGSTLYSMTWSTRTTPALRPYCRLVASERRVDGIAAGGWQSPRARGDSGGSRWKMRIGKQLEDQCRIFALDRGLTVEEVARLSVSPTFYRRLMGYPEEWHSCGHTAMQSFRKSPRRSSKRTAKQ